MSTAALHGGRRHLALRCSVAGVLTLTLALTAAVAAHAPRAEAQTKRPNIIVILTDDQRWDDLRSMPALGSAGEFARFTNSFVHEPQCCPSRATFFTGRYPSHTGVTTLIDGRDLDDRRTVATMLDDAGYRTGHFGKYLNGYPFGRGRYVPPGWDRFVAYRGPTLYFDYQLSENGTLVPHDSAPEDYSTDVFGDMAEKFVRTTDRSTPFFLYLSLNAPHRAKGFPVPAPRHVGTCADEVGVLPSTLNGVDTVSEPEWMRDERPKEPFNLAIEAVRRCETLQTVDEVVTSLESELERSGRLDDTYLVFTSDNGYALGEHRLFGKGDLYEPSIRVPLLVRGPDVRSGPIDRLTSNIDLVPTILDWARVRAPRNFLDGSSFAGDLTGGAGGSAPDAVLLRGCRSARAQGYCGGYPSNMGKNWGLRTAQYKYIEYPDGYVQLFDLAADPGELTNLGVDPAWSQVVRDLHDRLERMRD
jgi:arylsulfatase A-like enzyme